MDPLHKLWELYDQMNVVDKPSLAPPESATMGTPMSGDYNHPEIQKKKDLDDARATGMSPEEASQYVSGQVETDNVDSKAQFAADLGRFQQNNAKKGVKVDKVPVSIFAQDQIKQDQISPLDLKTPSHKEVPDAIQGNVSTPNEQPMAAESVDIREDYDYNLDVAYLQKYGRA